jgi:hypothetical protein
MASNPDSWQLTVKSGRGRPRSQGNASRALIWQCVLQPRSKRRTGARHDHDKNPGYLGLTPILAMLFSLR